MKKLNLFLWLILVGGLITTNFSQTPTTEITAEDVQQIRRIIADRDYWKARAEEEARQKDEWKKSSATWEKLFESEKYRADVLQENRITELKEANKSLTSANFQLREQSAADRERLSEQQFTINKLKSSRKWYFAAGLGVGFGTGLFTGYQVKAKFTF